MRGKKTIVMPQVDLPPMPKLVVGPLEVKHYKHQCEKCGKFFESTIAKFALTLCRPCWQNKSPKSPSGSVKYTFEGLKWKKTRKI